MRSVHPGWFQGENLQYDGEPYLRLTTPLTVVTISQPIMQWKFSLIIEELTGRPFKLERVDDYIFETDVGYSHYWVNADALWAADSANHAQLLVSTVIRYALALAFPFVILGRLFHLPVALSILLAPALGFVLVFNKWTKRSYKALEKTFQTNLRSRDMRAEYLGEKKPQYASSLMDKDLHLADFDVPPEVEWAGKELRELNFGQQYGVHVVSILRGKKRINIPKATDRLFPNDRIQVIGTDAGLESFGAAFPQPDTSLPGPTSKNKWGIPVSSHKGLRRFSATNALSRTCRITQQDCSLVSTVIARR